jgi:myo-inositol-1(or 4)-monophosphatase
MSPMPELPASESGKVPLEVARACSALANDLIEAGFGRATVSGVKGRGNVVTEVDLTVERACTDVLRREYPGHAILSEETAATVRDSGWMWVIDPVDGTKNFSRGIPHFCFTIALCHAHEPVVALTSQPLLGEEFVAVRGEGTKLNGNPMTVSDVPLEEAVIAVDLGFEVEKGLANLELARKLWQHVGALRIPGSAALDAAYLAAGRWDFYAHSSLEPWDLAAGLLLVREAGGEVRSPAGAQATLYDPAVVAGAPELLSQILGLAGHTAPSP